MHLLERSGQVPVTGQKTLLGWYLPSRSSCLAVLIYGVAVLIYGIARTNIRDSLSHVMLLYEFNVGLKLMYLTRHKSYVFFCLNAMYSGSEAKN